MVVKYEDPPWIVERKRGKLLEKKQEDIKLFFVLIDEHIKQK